MSYYGNRDSDVFVLYSSATWKTGSNLGRYLNCMYGTTMPGRRFDYLIRWGSSDSVPYIPEEETLNLRSAVSRNTDKFRSLQICENSQLNTVPHTESRQTATQWLALDECDVVYGRDTNHRGGTDIDLYHEVRDLDGGTNDDFYTQGIDVQDEYRVYVTPTNTYVRVKEQREEPSDDADSVLDPEYVRNHDNGYRFVYADTVPSAVRAQGVGAVSALNLDHGAVDVVYDGREAYILEVNTAPSLDQAMLERYARSFAQRIGLYEDYAQQGGGFRNTNLYQDTDEWDEDEVSEMWATVSRSQPADDAAVQDDADHSEDTETAHDAAQELERAESALQRLRQAVSGD